MIKIMKKKDNDNENTKKIQNQKTSNKKIRTTIYTNSFFL